MLATLARGMFHRPVATETKLGSAKQTSSSAEKVIPSVTWLAVLPGYGTGKNQWNHKVWQSPVPVYWVPGFDQRSMRWSRAPL